MSTFLYLILASITLVVVSIIGYRLSPRLQHSTALQLHLITFALYFGAGPLLAFYAADWQLPEVTVSTLLLGYLACGMYVGGILVASRFWRYSAEERARAEMGEEPRSRFAEALDVIGHMPAMFALIGLSAVFLVRIYTGVRYGLFFSGDSPTMLAQLPYGVTIARNLALIITPGVTIWACVRLFGGYSRPIPLIVLTAAVMLAFLEGRRDMLYVGLTVLFIFTLIHGIRPKLILLGVVASMLMLALLMPYFLAVRNIRQDLSRNYDAVESTVVAAGRAMTEFRDPEHSLRYWGNLAVRPLFLTYPFAIIEAQSLTSYMYGEATLAAIVRSIPYALMPSKRVADDEEIATANHYGFTTEDKATTWLAIGLADLGVIGAGLAGLLVGLIIRGVEAFACAIARTHLIGAVLLIGAGMNVAMHVEHGGTFLFNTPRDTIVLVVLSIPLSLPLRRVMGSRLGEETPAPYPAYPAEAAHR